jgi:hypothetical protein
MSQLNIKYMCIGESVFVGTRRFRLYGRTPHRPIGELREANAKTIDVTEWKAGYIRPPKAAKGALNQQRISVVRSYSSGQCGQFALVVGDEHERGHTLSFRFLWAGP